MLRLTICLGVLIVASNACMGIANAQDEGLKYADKASEVCVKLGNITKSGSSGTISMEGFEFKVQGTGDFNVFLGAKLVSDGKYSIADHNKCLNDMMDRFIELEKTKNPPQPRKSELWSRNIESAASIRDYSILSQGDKTVLTFFCINYGVAKTGTDESVLAQLDRFGDVTFTARYSGCEHGGLRKENNGQADLLLFDDGGRTVSLLRLQPPTLDERLRSTHKKCTNTYSDFDYYEDDWQKGLVLLEHCSEQNSSTVDNVLSTYGSLGSHRWKLNPSAFVADGGELKVKFVNYQGKDSNGYSHILLVGDVMKIPRRYGFVALVRVEDESLKLDWVTLIGGYSEELEDWGKELLVYDVEKKGNLLYIVGHEIRRGSFRDPYWHHSIVRV